jgi:hypothetical protein
MLESVTERRFNMSSKYNRTRVCEILILNYYVLLWYLSKYSVDYKSYVYKSE